MRLGGDGWRRGRSRLDEGINQALPGRRAPAGAQVITGHGVEFGRAAAARVVAGRDVVEGRRVADSQANRIEGRVDEADHGFTVVGRLLIDQRGKSRPQGR